MFISHACFLKIILPVLGRHCKKGDEPRFVFDALLIACDSPVKEAFNIRLDLLPPLI
jgi:hypothetical protein